MGLQSGILIVGPCETPLIGLKDEQFCGGGVENEPARGCGRVLFLFVPGMRQNPQKSQQSCGFGTGKGLRSVSRISPGL
jgi:hypothetical protein